MPPITGAYPNKIRTSEKKYCWKEGHYTQPQASDFCAKLSGRLPVIHTNKDNEDLGNAAGSVLPIFIYVFKKQFHLLVWLLRTEQ